MLSRAIHNLGPLNMKKRVAGKQRSANQLTGEAGQKIFAKWATLHRLSATKPEEDYGIDFHCQVFRDEAAGGQMLVGAVLAAQVRSTSVKAGKQRVKLNRDDAEIALRSDVPYVLVGVDVPRERIYFRFVDDDFMVTLNSFLAGNKKSLSWPLEEMESDEQVFYKHLDEICRPGRQHRLRLARAKLDIASAVPGSRISFLQTDTFGVAHVKMPLITAAFNVAAAMQKEATKIVFERGELPTDPRRFPLHPEFVPLADLVDGGILLEGAMEKTASLSVRLPDRAPITIPVGVRSIGDEMGYVLRSGLYLTFSAARRKGKQWVHEFDHGIAVKNAEALADVPEEMEFLKSLRESATLQSGSGPEITIDHWGNLRHLGPDLEQVENTMAQLSLSMAGLRLADVAAGSFLIGAGVAAAFLDGIGLEQICPGFVFEEPLNGAKLDQTLWHPCTCVVPIVMNLAKSGLVIWSSGAGSVYVADGMICGFRAQRQEKWSFEKREHPFAGIDAPELWLYRNWPGIPLGASGMHEATYSGAEHPFAATLTYETAVDEAAPK